MSLRCRDNRQTMRGTRIRFACTMRMPTTTDYCILVMILTARVAADGKVSVDRQITDQ
jgi:hypothetical protein